MTKIEVSDSPKMIRETLCVAQSLVNAWQMSRVQEHVDRLQRLIDECDRHRPAPTVSTASCTQTPADATVTEQPTTEQPRPDEAVQLVADIVASLYGVVTVESIGETILRELAAAGRLLPEGASPDRRMWIFPIEAKVDAILPDGTHRYWSTHCRHNRHDDCSASTMTRHRVAGGPPEAVPRPVEVHKAPAQCKSCLAPCICPCHAPVPINEESTDA